ncbi:MAG: FecR family protein, partial [Spirochaetota bacterium]
VPFLVGDVEVYNAENDEWTKIRTNHALVEGNVLRTNEESRCEIKLDDGTILKLESNTVIALGEFNFDEEGSQTLLDVISGSVLMKITKLGDDDEFNVKTVSAVAGVRGTEFQIKISGEKENSVVEIAVLEGKIAAKATEDVDNQEELILSSREGDEDTSADKIEKEEGGKTNMDKEKTIGVDGGYTVQFNWKSKETIVTKVPEQVTNITVNEVTEDEDDDDEDDEDDEDEE